MQCMYALICQFFYKWLSGRQIGDRANRGQYRLQRPALLPLAQNRSDSRAIFSQIEYCSFYSIRADRRV